MGCAVLSSRLIARLDVKGPNLVKGVHMEGLRVLGDPAEHAVRYYQDGIDEILYMDIVASLYQRNNLTEIVERTAGQVFVPLTVGGGVRTCDDIHKLLRAGADKVAINTAAIERPEFITEAARVFGSQCIVVSIEAKWDRTGGRWEAFTECGREHTGRNVEAWASEAVERGAGEILLTSVDNDGTKRGLDTPLIVNVADVCTVPLIASGGAWNAVQVEDGFDAGADAVALASMLHNRTETVGSLKAKLRAQGLEVRCA
jgi:cyclase